MALAQQWLDLQRTYEGIPAISYAVVKDQQTILAGGSGLADPQKQEAATADTRYSICSVSKLFTAVALMQLREEGKVALHDPVAKHLPWFTIPSAPDAGTVTVANILSHSSGLPRESDYPYWSGDFEFPTREQVRERIAAQPMLYPSDTYFQYSNLGLTLAGEIVAAAGNAPYETIVRTRILEPLGLTSTTTDITNEQKLAVGHSAKLRNGTRTTLPRFSAKGIAPAAGFASTATDLAKFASWQFRTLAGADDEVLDARTLRDMQRVHFVDPDFETHWGLGFAVRRHNDKTMVGHGGSCPGYRTDLTLVPSEKFAVAVLANASGVPVGRYSMALYEIVGPAKADSVPSADLAPYLGSYDDFPWGGETLFFSWGGDLAAISLPTMTPTRDLERYRKTGEHQFRRILKDDSLGETVTFEVTEGRATSYRVHSNSSPRMN